MGRAKRTGSGGAGLREAGPKRHPFREPATAGSPPEGSYVVGWGEVATGDYLRPEMEPIGTSILFVDSETGKLKEIDVSIEVSLILSDNLQGGTLDLTYETASLTDSLQDSLLKDAQKAIDSGESIDSIVAETEIGEVDSERHGSGQIEADATLFIEYEFEDNPVREVENGEEVLRKIGTRRSEEALHKLESAGQVKGEESAAKGKAQRTASRPRDVSEALSEAASKNDFLDLQSYGEYGVLSDMVSMYDSNQSSFTEDQVNLARETVHNIEAIASDREKRGELGKEVFSEEGLRVAESILRELSEGCEGETAISESMDPDGAFLFQSDEDHCLAMADYLSVLRTGKAFGYGAEGISESWRERNAAIGDAARDAAKY